MKTTQNSSTTYITAKEYLVVERASPQKNEYYDGHISEMPGASLGHNLIVANLIFEIRSLIREGSFLICPSGLRVASPGLDSYMYPDVSIVSGKAILEDDTFDTLLNPSVVIEVMSSYSKERDMGYKFFRYQRIPSLKEYLLIDSRSWFVQAARKQENDTWKFERIENDMKALLAIETIPCQVPLKNIYYRVDL